MEEWEQQKVTLKLRLQAHWCIQGMNTSSEINIGQIGQKSMAQQLLSSPIPSRTYIMLLIFMQKINFPLKSDFLIS